MQVAQTHGDKAEFLVLVAMTAEVMTSCLKVPGGQTGVAAGSGRADGNGVRVAEGPSDLLTAGRPRRPTFPVPLSGFPCRADVTPGLCGMLRGWAH
jgi:hypothetical protein